VRRVTATGALAELLQHEIDHLDGVLAIDRALDSNSLCTREEYERRYAPRAIAKGEA
jgi:peptide deformylase